MTQNEPLNVELLDSCMDEMKARLAAHPAMTARGADATLLQLRLARAVVEGVQLFGEDAPRIVAFALDVLPCHRAGADGVDMDDMPRTHPPRGFRPMLLARD